MNYELWIMNERENLVVDKSFSFAVKIVKLCRFLQSEKKEFVLSKQLLRSGTAIGALVRESQNAESPADFIHKLSIAQKECDETIYWLELLQATDYINETEFQSIHSDAVSLLKITRSIIVTMKQRIHNP